MKIVHADWAYIYENKICSFDANGGKTTLGKKAIIYMNPYGTLPTPTRDGYSFKGWFTEAEGGTQITSDTIVSVTSNQTLYAQWKEIIPYTKSIVTKSGTTYTVKTELYNFTTPYEILVVGYKNKKFVSVEKRLHSEENTPYTLEGDIDEIKVMVWDSVDGMMPLCEAEVIPSSGWESV